MSVKISNINHDVFLVNGKTVSKDMNGNWVAQEELTPAEGKSFREYLQDSEKNKG